MKDASQVLRSFLRAMTWHRRLLAAGLAAAAMAVAIEAASPAPPRTVEVAVAARDLSGGVILDAAHLTVARFPPEAVPAGLVDTVDAVGRVLASPVREGETITDRRLVGPELLAGWDDDLVAAPVRVADAAALRYVRPGDRIDLFATPLDGVGDPDLVASAVPVLALPPTEHTGPADDLALAEGAPLLLAVTSEQAARLAAAAVTSRLSFTFRSSTIGGPESG